MRFVGGVVLATAVVAIACGGPPPSPPSAVITADPERLCAGDGGATLVHLDAKSSSPKLSLVAERPDPADLPLRFTWSFRGSGYTIEDGDLASDSLVLRVAADRPLHVTLRVETARGATAESMRTIPIVLPDGEGRCAP